jgi:hypothetical protein
MSIEHWWNDTDRRKLKYWKENLSQYYSVHNKSHTDWPEIEQVPPWGMARQLEPCQSPRESVTTRSYRNTGGGKGNFFESPSDYQVLRKNCVVS